jgi:type II secretory pathway component PulF
MERSGLFPPVARRMVAVGESSGTLTSMLGRVAQAYEEETDRALSTLTSLVEPIIILTMGLLVGFIVLAVLLPIFDLSGLVG